MALFKKWIGLIMLISLMLLMAACGRQEGVSFAAEDIPEEPAKEEIANSIQGSNANEIDDLLESNFPLMTEVEGDAENAEIYATTQFGLNELSSLLTGARNPEQISDVEDNQQVLIYPDHFVTLRESEEDSDVLMIEVAGDAFVRRNYSPNFLTTYFSIRLLDSMLGTSNWGRSGGYTGMGSLGDAPTRGNTTFRGGGPGAGK
ncbi:DUF4247 domain-containing protein [Lentibacillus sediminis]|uniref:DUF4247 domain-containing protein n=1 Tax=Lentibacillus sediminis TaxID=1940529 RepID=UPI001EFC829F|nr:DUF4247 domain-containing protein [Lentibacillus sediminis]